MSTNPTTVVSATVVTTDRDDADTAFRALSDAAAELARSGVDVSITATTAPAEPELPAWERELLARSAT